MKHFNLKYRWQAALGTGVVLIALGLLAMAIPFVSTLGVVGCLAAVFFVSGVFQLARTVALESKREKSRHFLLGALSLAAAFLTFWNPMVSAVGLTLAIAFYLVFGAVVRGLIASELPWIEGKSWLTFSAIVSLCLGVYLILMLPVSSLMVPGVLVGVDLVFYGGSLLAEANELRKSQLASGSFTTRRAA